MKKLLFFLLGAFLYTSVSSQSITVRFEGSSTNANNTRDYTIELDGQKYYSSSSEATANGIKQVVVNNLSLGSHDLVVYDNSQGTQLYSKTFQLRTGYDMIIAIRRNGNVTFTEKKMKETAGSGTSLTPVTDAQFNTILTSIKAKWSQSSRVSAAKTALANKAYYFTTDQVGQMLMQVNTDASRLELAKLAYPKVTDPINFSDVVDLLNTQTTKDNLLAFIRQNDPDDIVNGQMKPLTTTQFNQLLRNVRNQYNQSGKYSVVYDALSTTTDYFTTAQIRQLLTLITTEANRLTLAKLSYARVTDSQNFATLNNLFTTQASRDDLSNYTRNGGSLGSTGQYASRIAMTDNDFSKLHTKTRLHFRQSSVVADVKAAFSNTSNYFTTEQTRALLSLVSSESDRLTLAKLAYHRAADPTSFNQLMDLFTTQTIINDLTNYIKINPS